MDHNKLSELSFEIKRNAHNIIGDSSDYDALGYMFNEAKVVLLGESSHGTHEFYFERAIIAKRLIMEHGFNAIAIEGDWPDAYRVNQCVRGASQDSSVVQSLDGFKRLPLGCGVTKMYLSLSLGCMNVINYAELTSKLDSTDSIYIACTHLWRQ